MERLLIVLGAAGLALALLLAASNVTTQDAPCGSVLAPHDAQLAEPYASYPTLREIANGRCADARRERRSAAVVVGVPSLVTFAMGMWLDHRSSDETRS